MRRIRTILVTFTILTLIGLFLPTGIRGQQQPQPQRSQPSKQGPAWQAPADAKILKDIEYANVSGKSLKLDLYLPKSQASSPKPALLVWIHGGGWRGGNKEATPITFLVGKGYALASISYRLSDVATFPAQIHDCKGAIRWLRAHAGEYGYDATKIGISGGSAGGHLVALLGTTAEVKELEGETGANTDQSSRVQAVVDYFGPTDFPRLAEQGHPEFTTSLSALMLGTPISSGKKQAELASPLYHVTKDDAPVLIIQGTKDPLVFVPQSRAFHDAYQKLSLESHLEIIEGGAHGGPQFWDETRMAMIEKFFDKHIKRK